MAVCYFYVHSLYLSPTAVNMLLSQSGHIEIEQGSNSGVKFGAQTEPPECLFFRPN